MANTYLNRTPGAQTTAGRKTWTYSVWLKRSGLGSSQNFLWANQDGSNYERYMFDTNDKIYMAGVASGSTAWEMTTSRAFRDPSAWYHIVIVRDTTQGTASNRLKLYVNGTQETAFGTNTPPAQDYTGFINSTNQHNIGRGASSEYFDGYMSHVAFVDSTALTPTSFGSTEASSGIWKFSTPSGITWGTNGFHLKFENSGALGTDSSGNSNTFTVNGSLTQSVDTPSINYVTLHPLVTAGSGTMTHSRANTRTGGGNGISFLTMMPTSGKWFCEFHFNAAGAGQDNGIGFWSVPEAQDFAFYVSGFKGIVWKYAGNVYVNSVNNSFSSNTFTAGDIISVAMDMDNSTATFYKNGSVATNLNAYSFPFTEREAITVGVMDGASASAEDEIFDFNSGANPTFGGRKTAGGNSDANGQGNFSMAVPSGYYALNTKNLNTYG